jgi:citrate lyase subunit gamma (acyl carrier protein)
MSQIIRRASAGTLESSDVLVQIAPSDDGLHIRLDSVVQAQFGDDILSVVKEVLNECGIEQANLNIQDRGALDCVIRARVETAIIRGKG